MANRELGEISFEAGNKDYFLCYSPNACCEFEDAAGITIVEMAQTFNDPSDLKFSMLRHLFWAGLLDCKPDISLKEAGEVMKQAGGIKKVMLIVTSAFNAAFPEGKGDDDKGGDESQEKS